MKISTSLPLAFSLVAAVGAFAPAQSFTRSPSTSSLSATIEGRQISEGGMLKPTNNFILVKVAEIQDKTDSGILLTGSAKIQKTEGEVIAVGPGKTHPESGKIVPMPVDEGEGVVYGEYDGIEIEYNGDRHTLIRDDNVLVKFKGDTLTKDSVEATGDNVLVQVETKDEETSGGLVIAKSKNDNSRPSTGTVVSVGPGKMASDGTLMPMTVAVGDRVKFTDFAGNEVQIGEDEFSVVKMADVLAKF
mmetsp:Transcript_6163/g.13548  ORF Transcript_6163/g.13548 Transcript_6163/m.13548 type:complete len:246 (+) Transcript_6163:97-834(+)